MNWDSYSDIVIDRFMCPRNVGSMKDADAEGTFGDASCGDSLTIYIKVEDDIIVDISYLVYGCPASIATSSMTSEMVKGKSVIDVMKITEEDIIDNLGGLPEQKKHCSNLGIRALHKAIENYYIKIGGKGNEKS